MDTSREILKRFYSSDYVTKVIESASRRHGAPCRVVDNPINGVVVVADDPAVESPVVVELTEDEKTLLLVEVGKAFSKLVRM